MATERAPMAPSELLTLLRDDTIRAELRTLVLDAFTEIDDLHQRRHYLMVSESEAAALASGYVPSSVVALAEMALLENSGTRDQQRADRPVRRR